MFSFVFSPVEGRYGNLPIRGTYVPQVEEVANNPVTVLQDWFTIRFDLTSFEKSYPYEFNNEMEGI